MPTTNRTRDTNRHCSWCGAFSALDKYCSYECRIAERDHKASLMLDTHDDDI